MKMLKLIALFVILAVASSSEPMLKFPLVDLGLTPFKGQCSADCDEHLRKTVQFYREYVEKYAKEVQLQNVLSSCNCILHGTNHFGLDIECGTDGKQTDYTFVWTHKHMDASCSCELPNNPRQLAEIVSLQDKPTGTCGEPPYAVNAVKYQKFTCSGSGEGKSNIRMNLTMKNVAISGTEKEDLESMQLYSILANGEVDSASLTYDGNPDFQDSFQCIQNHVDTLAARVVGAFAGWFWPCTYGRENQFIHNKVVENLKCKL